MILIGTLAITLPRVPGEAMELAMRSPPSKMDQHEQVLNSDEVSKAAWTDRARSIVADRPGIVMSSEEVTRSDQFGYIYRYQVVRVLDDDVDQTKIRSVFVLWTTDCETFRFASYPMYRLPGEKN